MCVGAALSVISAIIVIVTNPAVRHTGVVAGAAVVVLIIVAGLAMKLDVGPNWGGIAFIAFFLGGYFSWAASSPAG